MNDLTPRFERETGQVTLAGKPGGAAGEAFLTPLPGLDLAFDRVDGRLCRVVVDVAGADGAVTLDAGPAALLSRLFGQQAPGVVLGAARPPGDGPRSAPPPGDGPRSARSLRPDPRLAATLSSLAECYAARATSPVPGGSPPVPALDVAAEVEKLEKDAAPDGGPQWMLDPRLVPAGLFRFGLSPYSDLVVSRASGEDRIVVEALLAPDADRRALADCRARLVLPAVRRILAQAGFTVVGFTARAELPLSFSPHELAASWVEVVHDKVRPVHSLPGHLTRRALRWADAALRAERAPAALDPVATLKDWSALAAVAWGRCRLDWAAAGDHERARQAAGRRRPGRRLGESYTEFTEP